MTNLKAEGDFQNAILEYLNTVEDEVFIQKVNSGDKDLESFERWIRQEMKKRVKDGCAIAKDQEIFGLAMHYFEEDGIPKATVKIPAKVVMSEKPVEKPKVEKPKAIKTSSSVDLEGQLSLEW